MDILFFFKFYSGLGFFVMTLYYFYYENKKHLKPNLSNFQVFPIAQHLQLSGPT